MINLFVKSKKIFNQIPFLSPVRQHFANYTARNPKSGEVFADFGQEESSNQMKQRLLKLDQGRKNWNILNQEERKSMIEKFTKNLAEQKVLMTETLQKSTGKNISECEQQIKFCLELLETDLKSTYDKEKVTQSGKYTLQPFQNVLITYDHRIPAISSLKYIVPAMVSGNCLILKPKRYAFPIAKLVEKLWNQSVPEHPILYVPVNKYFHGLEEMVTSKQTGFVSFSGDIEEGNEFYYFMARNSQIFAQSEFLLTSSDSAYVRKNLTDQDLKQAAEMVAKGAFSNGGNNFCSIKRIFLDKQIEQKFTQYFLQAARKYSIQTETMTPLISSYHMKKAKQQMLELKKVEDDNLTLLTNLNEKQTKLTYSVDPIVFRVNGISNLEYWNTPFLLPLVFIQTVSNPEVCVEKINESIYGITSSIFTKDPQEIEKIGKDLDVGVVNGNYWGFSCRVAYSGRKRSGKGFSFSSLSLGNVVRSRSISDSVI